MFGLLLTALRYGSMLFSVWVGVALAYGSALLKIPIQQALLNLVSYSFSLFLAIFHMIASNEKAGKKPPNSAGIKDVTKIKKIVFVRHGESVWNDIFNKGKDVGLLVRLIRGLVNELGFACSNDSLFLDTPLSPSGESQAEKLAQFIRDGKVASGAPETVETVLKALRGESPATFLCSNLRRAIDTAAIALPKATKVTVFSDLQEMSRNVDTQSLLPQSSVPSTKFSKSLKWDQRMNKGNKSFSSKGISRMTRFAHFATNNVQDEVVVAIGHSIWFKTFFKHFLPHDSQHEAKLRKIENCGVVVFNLEYGKIAGAPGFRIDPKSIEPVYLGFHGK